MRLPQQILRLLPGLALALQPIDAHAVNFGTHPPSWRPTPSLPAGKGSIVVRYAVGYDTAQHALTWTLIDETGSDDPRDVGGPSVTKGRGDYGIRFAWKVGHPNDNPPPEVLFKVLVKQTVTIVVKKP